ATHLLVVASTGTSTAGTPISVSVTALDQYGNTATGYRGIVHFTSTDSQAVAGAGLPANYTFVAGDNGVRSFTVTLDTAGSQTVTATDTVTSTITGTTNPISVSAAALSKLSVAASPSTVTA